MRTKSQRLCAEWRVAERQSNHRHTACPEQNYNRREEERVSREKTGQNENRRRNSRLLGSARACQIRSARAQPWQTGHGFRCPPTFCGNANTPTRALDEVPTLKAVL